MSVKKDLIIVGAGGFGREVFNWVQDVLTQNPTHTLIGYIDDRENSLDHFNYPLPILGSIQNHVPQPNQDLLISIADPKIRGKIVTTLSEKGASFFTLIHPSVRISHNSIIGKGCVLCPGVIVTNDTTVGNFVIINLYTTIGHDVIIRDWTTINGHCDITGNCKLGEYVFMGSRSGTIPGLKIGDHAKIAAGSTVFRNVPEGKTFIGCPAKSLY